MENASVTVYSASWCAFCHAVKQYLDKLHVKYTDKDIESDPAIAKEAMDKSGQTGIPIVIIGDSLIIGFDRPKIDSALKSNHLI